MLDFFTDVHVTLSVSTPGKLKNFLTTAGIEPTAFGLRGQHISYLMYVYINVEATRFSCEIFYTRTNLTSQLSWWRIGLAN